VSSGVVGGWVGFDGPGLVQQHSALGDAGPQGVGLLPTCVYPDGLGLS
jgi:hypothetical protein